MTMEPHVNPEDPDLYALGALDEEGRAALEAHVHSCVQCAQQVAAAQQRIALVGLTAEPVAVPPRVKEELMQRVRAERDAQHEVVRQRRSWQWLVPALAMSTILFAALAGWQWSQNRNQARQIATLRGELADAQSRSLDIARASEAVDRVAVAAGTIHVALAPQPGMQTQTAAVLYNPRSGVVAYFAQMQPAPPDKSYQLWLVPAAGAPISLGVFSGSEPAIEFTTRLSPGIAASAFAVTLEPKGGRPQPTGAKILVGAVKT